MSFSQYLRDQGSFFVFYIILMGIVTIMTAVGAESLYEAHNVVYIHTIGLFIVLVYILTGYYRRMSFYRELNDLAGTGHEEFLAAMPKPQNNEQQLYVKLLKKLHDSHVRQLQSLHTEKKDHQDFIASWIHEVKVPIAASRLLMETGGEIRPKSTIDKLEDELDRIENYVEQALYYSRIDSFSKDYFIMEVLLDSLVKKTVKKYAKTFIDKKIRFHMEDTLQAVHTDSKWLRFILDQIVFNSLKYTDPGGEISVRFEEDHKEKRLLIQDNGIGIKEEELHRVFEKGFTGSVGRQYSKSTGIGLYLAKQLALKLDHDLSIQSEEGLHTTVFIHFPKYRNYYPFDYNP